MSALLALRGVSKTFGEVRALHDVSFDAAAGEVVGIIGPNGAGKSTLVDIIAGRIRPSAGGIRFDGLGLERRPAYAITRLGVARTFQIARPFAGATVLESVLAPSLFGREGAPRGLRAARQRAEAMLARVGLAGREQFLAERLDIGDRKRLQLAQALVTAPRLLLLDELMAGLPPAQIDALVRTIREVAAGGVAVLVVEHVMRAIAALAHRIVVLHHGEKIADDPPGRVFADVAVMRAYLGPRFAATRLGELR